jgi:DnaD/phage-associated family protein
MKGFGGFHQKDRLIKIPGQFFSELLSQIDSLNEMKVTLYCFWRLQQKGSDAPYLWEDELAADAEFMSGLAPRASERFEALRDGLERSVTRGTLLSVDFEGKKQADRLYFVNTARGRAMITGLQDGKWTPQDPDTLLALNIERPNIYTLYEQNIGPLTPLLAENLQEIEQHYSSEWITEAVEIAVQQNKRSLAYIEAILKRWQTEGRGEKKSDDRDGWSYVSGTFGSEIEH